MDLYRWLKIKLLTYKTVPGLIYLLTFYKEFRNVFYLRIGRSRHLLNPLCPKLNSLFLPTKSIKSGLYIEHGFSTIVAAESIGENCWINQQVTIGYKNRTEGPTILDNVTINAGAIVIGKITISNNVTIGAGAVVTKSVPSNCTVVGNPARIVRRDGGRVDIKL
jgi:serine O-acetyltransferase